MTYSEKLKNPKWQKKRLEILNRDNFTCKYCSDTETELQIHHLKYSGKPWGAPNENLITCCKHCHIVLEQAKKFDSEILKTIKYLNEKDMGFILAKQTAHNSTAVICYYLYEKDLTHRVGFMKDTEMLYDLIKLNNE